MKKLPITLCVVIANRANYGRIKTVLQAAKMHPDVNLQIVVTSSMMLERYGRAIDVIKQDGFDITEQIYNVVEGETPQTQTKTTGLYLIELSSTLERLKPDYVLTVADRYETLANAIAATYANIPLIHVQGGEISGNIDDRVRHAITKLADLHFPSTQDSYDRIIKMGEDPDTVFNYGCPAIDLAISADKNLVNLSGLYQGVGGLVNWHKDYILMVQHPVTTEYGQGFEHTKTTLEALCHFSDKQKIILWPNIDAGSDHVAKALRVFREKISSSQQNFYFFRNFTPEDYIKVFANAICVVGNSSSFIREGAALGIPAVNIGNRQTGREHGENVIFTDYNHDHIIKAIQDQINHGAYKRSDLFGTGIAGKQMGIRNICKNFIKMILVIIGYFK